MGTNYVALGYWKNADWRSVLKGTGIILLRSRTDMLEWPKQNPPFSLYWACDEDTKDTFVGSFDEYLDWIEGRDD